MKLLPTKMDVNAFLYIINNTTKEGVINILNEYKNGDFIIEEVKE